MVFYNRRKKTGTAIFIGGCAIFIGISALITVFTLAGTSLFSEYPFQSIIILVMTGVFIYPFFRKKGKVYKDNIQVKNDHFIIDGNKILLSKINLDSYQMDGKIFRYHLWDTASTFSLYSVSEDDLYNHLKTTDISHTFFETLHSKSYNEKINITTDKRTLSYNLETGGYKITEGTTIVKDIIPAVFCFDGEFSLTT